MDSFDESLSNGSYAVEDADEFSLILVNDIPLSEYAGHGMLAVSVAMTVAYGIGWIIGLFRRA